jgi:hypothetical protein
MSRPIITAFILTCTLFAGCIDEPLSPTDAPSARILITAHMGTVLLDDRSVVLQGDDTAMSILQEIAHVETAHDGDFVHAINGKTSGHPHQQSDWFFHINSTLASAGATYTHVHDGDLIVWDHRTWNHTMTLPYLLTGLSDWPPMTSTHGPEALAQQSDNPHIFLQIQEDDHLRLLDPWRTNHETIPPPWAFAHVTQGAQRTPELLLVASGPDAEPLLERLSDHAPTGLGFVFTPQTTHNVPAPHQPPEP